VLSPCDDAMDGSVLVFLILLISSLLRLVYSSVAFLLLVFADARVY
jgi:hypothetical protein